MRIGCVYARRQHWPKWDWVRSALIRLGHEVVRVNDASQLRPADEVCDLMLFEHRACGIGWRNIRDLAPHRKARWAQWWWDLFAWDQPVLTHMLARYGDTPKMFDRVYVKERGCIGLYQSGGINAKWLDQGVPSDWAAAEHRDCPDWDVLGFGKLDERRNRKDAIKAILKHGFKVAWATADGAVPEGVERLVYCHPKDLSALMGRAKCVLCINYMDIDGYCSDRDWMVKGAGAIPVRNVDEVRAACGMTAGERRDMGFTLRRHTLATNTYEHRLRDIIDDYEKCFPVQTVQRETKDQCQEDQRNGDAHLPGV